MNKRRIVVCSVCGAQNDIDSIACDGCGAKLEGEEKTVEIESTRQTNEDIPEAKPQTKQKKKNNKSKKITEKSSGLVLGSTSIFYMIFSLVIIGGVLLYASGIFNEPRAIAVSGAGQQQQSQMQTDPHGGADLSKLQEIRDLETAVKNNPNDLQSTLRLAHLLNDSGFYNKAIENYQIYLKADPENPDVLVDMGVCYYSLNQYTQAIANMEKALQYQPNHQIAHLNLGVVNMAAGNLVKAKEWWQKAYSLNPNNEIGQRAKELLDNN
ncbi:MAG: tetratricopeptide repeat protein [Melioribacteraceae bacterium]|nr:tetratricopeptide repeat protein [Melioribacteraceae bacterium]MCF8356810.1 tetratricopeptide repeat protein [Melioribacteraceae bacterium]MCF8394265.1 tetratricopeptide repeat protein [Melioribacteraceae bacterium]MCF8418165.1 tetratricopeptide repeat protein [Melioribacteraceae bacterium]